MLASVAKLLSAASLVICLIVLASFVVFAANQAKSASNEQQTALSSGGAPSGSTASPAHGSTSKPRESSLHSSLDEASSELTSPFAGIFSGSHSEWGTRVGKLVLALLVYGFGLGYLARTLRVRT